MYGLDMAQITPEVLTVLREKVALEVARHNDGHAYLRRSCMACDWIAPELPRQKTFAKAFEAHRVDMAIDVTLQLLDRGVLA